MLTKKQDGIVRIIAPPILKVKISKRLKKIRGVWFNLQPESKAISTGQCELVAEIAGNTSNMFPAPYFHGRQPFNPIPDVTHVNTPPIRVTQHRHVQVLGWSNFLLHGRTATHPELYTPSRDCSPVEKYGKARMNPKFSQIRIPLGLPFGRLDRAINLCDQTPFNYAHWMTEILPKLAFISDYPELSNWPILVDDGICDNHIASIRAILPNSGDLIAIKSHEYVHVNNLINVSPTSYCPHEFREFHSAQANGFQFFFSEEALQRVRHRLRSTFSRFESGRSRHLYLKRTPLWTYNNRNIDNIEAIEDLLDERGIDMLNITGMTLEHQAKLFMNAKLIIAPTGAALTNMLFAPPGCRVLVLAAAYEGATYDYFHRIAHLLGHDLSFVIGPQVESDGYHMNRDYTIDLKDLRKALDVLLPQRSTGLLRVS